MFKVIINNPNTSQSPWAASFTTEIEAQNWLSEQIGLPWRKPERQIPSGEVNENGEPILITLPQEFTSEIINLSLDPVWVEQDISQKREKEYPSINQVVEALIEAIAENRPAKLNQIQALRQAVKNKYPKGGN